MSKVVHHEKGERKNSEGEGDEKIDRGFSRERSQPSAIEKTEHDHEGRRDREGDRSGSLPVQCVETASAGSLAGWSAATHLEEDHQWHADREDQNCGGQLGMTEWVYGSFRAAETRGIGHTIEL